MPWRSGTSSSTTHGCAALLATTADTILADNEWAHTIDYTSIDLKYLIRDSESVAEFAAL